MFYYVFRGTVFGDVVSERDVSASVSASAMVAS